ncbi:uncharacterized protein [Clytia hemisphaerica]|uniref:POU domain protein n=1 Tax=Clytia hemisphaerica TaxID=252671 RepID=A0A7M5X6Q7_9CNID|eukprot:TCONS_00053370-protein
MELSNMNELDIDLDVKSNLISLKEDQAVIGEQSYPAMQTILLTNDDIKQPTIMGSQHQIPPNVVIHNTIPPPAQFMTNNTLVTIQGDRFQLRQPIATFIQQQPVHMPLIANQVIGQPIDLTQTIYNPLNSGLVPTTSIVCQNPEDSLLLPDPKETAKNLKNYTKKLEKLKDRDIENDKFQKEILTTENLKSLVPELVDVTPPYFKKAWSDDENSSTSTRSSKSVEMVNMKEGLPKAEPIVKKDDNIIDDYDDTDIDLKLSTKEDRILTEETHESTVEKEEPISEEEIIEFTKRFKQRRVSLGFTQADVGLSLGNMLGNLFSQTHVCRFEAMQLSHNSMCNLYPLFSKWLDEVESKLKGDESSTSGKQKKTNIRAKKRRKRTSLDFGLKGNLEALFMTNQKPNGSQLSQIANHLKTEKEVVRVWFCNRRQREKKNVEVAGMFPGSMSLQPKPMFINIDPMEPTS